MPTGASVARLGVGIVWWPPLDPLCGAGEGLVDVIEAEPEAFWVPAPGGAGFCSHLPGALAHLPQPKLLHGVGSPLGGTCGPPPGHAATLAADIAALRPAHVSDHLSVTRFRPGTGTEPVSAGFMLPPAQSAAGVALAAANIRRHRLALGVPVAVETPVSYLPPAPGEWTDGAYVAAVAEAADCGILLDLHNVMCNARNGRQGAADFCAALPRERVWEVHLAGGEHEGRFYVDAHSGLVEPELMEILAGWLPGLPNLRAIILEIMPERVAGVGLSAIAGQLAALRELWARCAPNSAMAAPALQAPDGVLPIDPAGWEALLGGAVTGLPHPAVPPRLAAWWAESEPALELYRLLAGEGRASAIAAAAPRTTRLLLRTQGGPGTRRILATFWRQTPPAYTAADEARAFLRYIRAEHPALPGLGEAAGADADLLALA